MNSPRGPLAGLRVLDLAQTRAGAQATQTLADFGADVIWVEPPNGSVLRRDSAFPFLARGKRSVVADLHVEEGLERVRALAHDADVLVEGFRPGVAERLGIGFEDLAETNRSLVYASITGFGARGPWRDIKGYEGVVASILGVQQSFKGMYDGDHPPFVSVSWCSFSASQTALHGILSALIERERSGVGQRIDASMAQAFAVLDSWMWYLYLVTERYPDAYAPQPSVDMDGVPNTPLVFTLPVLQTKDGRWLQFAQHVPRLFEALMRAIGLGSMLTDPAWNGIPFELEPDQRVELLIRMLEAVRSKPLLEWEEIFAADHDVCAEVHRSGHEVLEHPQLVADHAVVEISDPERGDILQPAALINMSRTPAVIGGAAPSLGHGAPVWKRRESVPAKSGPIPSAGLPLEGVVVLELASMIAAPYGATLLTDFGARVIKVERLDGDPVRLLAAFPEAAGARVTQGKESIAVDISRPEGVEIVQKIAGRADAVLEGYREGAADRHNLGAKALLEINPNLVYLSARGYGTNGPYADRPAFGTSFGAASGIAAANLGGILPEDPNMSIDEVRHTSNLIRSSAISRYAQTDGTSALVVATALLLGLYAARSRLRRSAAVDLDAQLVRSPHG